MKLTRRDAMALGAGAAVIAGLPVQAAAPGADLVDAFTGGADVAEGGVTLNAPEIAENGNTVPIEVGAEGAAEIMVLALGNPTPPVATFKFGPMAASQTASSRIRLAQTQELLAVAKMEDGSFAQARATVKVTIGGCGG